MDPKNGVLVGGGLAAIVISACGPAVPTSQPLSTKPSYDFSSAIWENTTLTEERKAFGKDFSSVQAVYISILRKLANEKGYSALDEQDFRNLAPLLANVSKQESQIYGGDSAEPGPLQPFKILDKPSLEMAVNTYLARMGYSQEDAVSFHPYIVQPNDTISGLSSRYADPEKAAKVIIEKNGLKITVKEGDFIVYNLMAGQRYLLPNLPLK